MASVDFIVKNTFLCVPIAERTSSRRNSSIPRSWKPGSGKAFPSEVAGEAFEECLSEEDFLLSSPGAEEAFEDCCSEKGDSVMEEPISVQDTDEPYERWSSDQTDFSDDNWSFANTEDSFCVADLNDFDAWAGDSPYVVAEASTIDSPCAMIENGATALTTDFGPDSNRKGKVTLNLFNTVCPNAVETQVNKNTRIKLRSKAMPFASVSCPPAEVSNLVAGARALLQDSLDIAEVKVRDGGMGGTTLIMAHSRSASPNGRLLLSSVQKALLSLAEQSDNTYILGYHAQPFQKLDSLSFSATIARVPESHKNQECWDMYEKGFCPRCATCRWKHPSSCDTMKLIVTIVKNGHL